jgi:predicted RNA-binding Zn-ribbon protein involved in translation (DUF1610 family)
MKTTLCSTCKYGLVREWDCGIATCKASHFTNKCFFGDDYITQYITSCNRYAKSSGKTTYHDPDFVEYESSLVKPGHSCHKCGEMIENPDGTAPFNCPKCGAQQGYTGKKGEQ